MSGGTLKWQKTIKPMEAGGAALLSGHGLVYLPQLGGEVTALEEKTGKAIWIAGAPKPSPGGQIRVGGMCINEAGVWVTRNDQQRR
jgi:outer membrane protein assembly factor BamB